MNKFGFAIKTPRSENMDKVSLERYNMLLDREPSFKRCFQCGCCSATCSARQFTEFSIRRVHTSFRRGEYAGLDEELRKCMLCGKCNVLFVHFAHEFQVQIDAGNIDGFFILDFAVT